MKRLNDIKRDEESILKKQKISFRYNQGSSNAVRRTVTIQEFL